MGECELRRIWVDGGAATAAGLGDAPSARAMGRSEVRERSRALVRAAGLSDWDMVRRAGFLDGNCGVGWSDRPGRMSRG